MGGAGQGDGALVERQAVETRPEFRRESFQPVERPFLLEGQRVALQRRRGAEDAGAAAGAFLVVPGMRGGIGAEEEFRIARGRGLAQRGAVVPALGHRQAIGVRAHAALEQGIAVEAQVMRRDRRRDVRPGVADELHRVRRGDMLQHHLKPRKVPQQRRQHLLQERRLAVEDVDVGRGRLAVDQQRQADGLHPLQHRADVGDVGHPGIGIGGGPRRIELAGGEHALRVTGGNFVRIDPVGEIGGHQRREAAARRQCREDAVAVGLGRGDGGHRGHQVRHDDRPRELARREIRDQRQHGVVAQMQVPVVRLPKGEVVGRRGGRHRGGLL